MSEILRHLQDKKVRECLSAAADIRQTARNFLMEKEFREFDTPILIPKTGERYNAVFPIDLDGRPAMLADSHQICKMMLMLSGYEKYYQFAHCFRSIVGEDKLHTRLSEFVQLDVELRNIDFEGLAKLAEQFISEICRSLNKTPRITYMEGFECLEKYGESMNPDLRGYEEDLSLVIVRHLPLTNKNGVPYHHIFAKPQSEIFEYKIEKMLGEVTESFDIVVNGIEVGGGDLRIMNVELQRSLMRAFDVDENQYGEYLEMLSDSSGNQGGGFAIGLERLVMALFDADNICQTVAFPNLHMRDR